MPVKEAVELNPESLPESTDGSYGFEYLDISSVSSTGDKAEPKSHEFSDAPSRARRPVSPGDTFVSTVRTYLKAVGFAESDDENVVVSTGFVVLRPSPNAELNPRFLYYWARSSWFINEVTARSVGVSYPATTEEEIGSLPVPDIGRKLQRSIAEFLDRKTAAIDELIDKKRRLIELLEEKRDAVINRAVTKGLDPDVEMKDSGVPWIGEIPEDWELLNVNYFARLQRGMDLPADDRGDGEVPVVSSGGISGTHNEAAVLGPGVVTGRYGTVGEMTWVEDDYWPLNTTYYVREFFDNLPRFGVYALRILPLRVFTGKSAVPGIDRKDLQELRIMRPPLAEQRKISDFLDEKTERVDEAVAAIQDEIDKIQEYRQSLITAAVTGQIDVENHEVESVGELETAVRN
jgi:restriction endonuclease S subunit